jgi:hypothetical protein
MPSVLHGDNKEANIHPKTHHGLFSASHTHKTGKNTHCGGYQLERGKTRGGQDPGMEGQKSSGHQGSGIETGTLLVFNSDLELVCWRPIAPPHLTRQVL